MTTLTAGRTAPPIEPPTLAPPVADQPDDDRRPGSLDVGWAERAYHYNHGEPATRPSQVRH
jgi:hypothetical protein